MTTIAGEAPAPPGVGDTGDAREGLDPRVELLWQAHAAVGWLAWTAIAAVALLAADRPPAWALLVSLAGLVYTTQVPPRRYRHFGFRVGQVDVRVWRGWLWRTESVVLHSRIQHVDVRQGPVERAMGLATVVVFTAGSVGAMVGVPGLRAERAEALRDRLVRLSGTDDAV